MSELTGQTELDKVRTDADGLIQDIIKKIPNERKVELLAVVNGFILGINSENPINHIDS